MTYYDLDPADVPTDDTVRAVATAEWKNRQAKAPSMYPEEGFDEWLDWHFDSFRRWIEQPRAKPLATVPYERELTDYGYLMTVEDFVAHCGAGGFIDYDGHGRPVRRSYAGFSMADFDIRPSTRHLIPKDATHIMWYNR